MSQWHGHLGGVSSRAGSPCHKISYSPKKSGPAPGAGQVPGLGRSPRAGRATEPTNTFTWRAAGVKPRAAGFYDGHGGCLCLIATGHFRDAKNRQENTTPPLLFGGLNVYGIPNLIGQSVAGHARKPAIGDRWESGKPIWILSGMVQKGVRYSCAKHPTNLRSVPGRSGNCT
jgi:hypothetical protein